jgi:hypothetical protein
MDGFNLNDTYWDRLRGYVTELRVDARWVLRQNGTKKPLGSLRIVSHPDLPPGNLRAHFTYVTSIKQKTKEQKLKAIEDYQMEVIELEVYSISDDIKTESQTYVALFKELQDMFGIDIFEKEKK